MAAKERICFCCGKKYKYCNTCGDYDPDKTWMFLVHDEKCLDVYNVWQQYRGKEITKEEAAKVLKALDVTEILKSNTMVVPVLKEILDIKDEPKKVETKEQPEVVKKENGQQFKPQKQFNQNRNDKK